MANMGEVTECIKISNGSWILFGLLYQQMMRHVVVLMVDFTV